MHFAVASRVASLKNLCKRKSHGPIRWRHVLARTAANYYVRESSHPPGQRNVTHWRGASASDRLRHLSSTMHIAQMCVCVCVRVTFSMYVPMLALRGCSVRA